MTPRSLVRPGLLALALLVLGVRPLTAQGSASVAAVATVLGGDLLVEARQHLDFGRIEQGMVAVVAPDGANAGQWRAAGDPNAEVRLAFVLPDELRGSNGFPLAVSFTGNVARWNERDAVTASRYFEPRAGTVARFSNGQPPSTLFVWIGGTVHPSQSQPPATYVGTIVLTLSYTGS